VIVRAALRLLTRRCLRGDVLVCLDAAQPGSIVTPQGISAIAAVPRDQANERNDVLEKIVAGELNILLERHISHIVKCLGSDMP
jgi:hypothetical protein